MKVGTLAAVNVNANARWNEELNRPIFKLSSDILLRMMSISAESWQLSLGLLVTRPETLSLPAIESFNAWKFRVHKYKTEGKLICSKPGPDWLLNTKMLGKDIVSVLPGDSFSVSSFILRMIGFFYRCGKRMFQATGADRGGALDNQLRIPSPPLSILLLFFLNSWLDVCNIRADCMPNLLVCMCFFK